MYRYLFADMDSYFASVEQHDRPELRGQPVGIVPVVADSTCCIAASYQAKAFGVRTGTAVVEAKKLCPHIRLVEARPKRYVELHHQIIEAVESCLHVDRVCSIDEMVARLMGKEREPAGALAMGRKVKEAIREKVGLVLTCSVGLSTNHWLAKIASERQKPDGLTAIPLEEIKSRLSALELEALPGVGRRMNDRLLRHGVTSVAQLCELPVDRLAAIWGSKVIAQLWHAQLRGEDVGFAVTHRRTVGHSHVLAPDKRTMEGARAVMVRMIHKAARRLRGIDYLARRLDINVEFMDRPSWHAWTPVTATGDTLTLLHAFAGLWEKLESQVGEGEGENFRGFRDFRGFRGGTHGRRPWAFGVKPIHTAVTLSDLVARACATGILYEHHARLQALAKAMDRIDERYGWHTVYFASMLNAQRDAPTRISFTQIPLLSEF